jgi:hypothetical protein
MKIALCVAFLLGAGVLPSFHLIAASPSPDTAYQALRTVGAQRGADVLKHVIEVQGQGGIPQPIVWRVVLDDPAARGSVREVDVAHGRIVAEHTPLRAYSGSAAGALIDFHKLNLDSSGAFTVAEKEAQKARIGFDSVDYILRTGDGPNGDPIWVIHMMDASRHSIGTMSIAADNGSVVSSDLYGHHPQDAPPGPQPPQPSDTTVHDVDHDNLYAPSNEPPPVRRADDSDTEDTSGLRIGHRIKQAFLSAGESLKNFVTGADR